MHTAQRTERTSSQLKNKDMKSFILNVHTCTQHSALNAPAPSTCFCTKKLKLVLTSVEGVSVPRPAMLRVMMCSTACTSVCVCACVHVRVCCV